MTEIKLPTETTEGNQEQPLQDEEEEVVLSQMASLDSFHHTHSST